MRFGARIESSSTLIDVIGPNVETPSYQIDFDYLPITGYVNTNLDFRYRRNFAYEQYNPYEVHFITDTSFWTNFGYPTSISISPLLYNQVNHVTVILRDQHIQFYLNGIEIIDYADNTYIFSGDERIGLRISTGGAYPTEVWFDNVKISSVDDYDNLDVPDIKQTTSPWASMEYDSASKWFPADPTISSWGCAITSAVMVLNYQGYKKLPDGTTLDPGSLNSWLKDQSDGYVKNGFLNWLAVTRLTMQSKTINDITRFDALEYEKILTEDKEMLTNDIKNDMPDILEVPNHFVVAKGINGDTFTINDPAYSDRTDLTSYSNSFTTLGRYVPSSTDLSYFMIVGNKDLDIKLKDNAGNYIGQQFIQNPITNNNNNLKKKW
jgi:hypothetical protein